MANYFAKNLKYLREKEGLSKSKLAEKVGINQSTITRYESEEITPTIENVEQIANALNVELPDMLITDLKFNNAEYIDINNDNTVLIPVLGTIKAGIPMEAQQDIIEYVDIPKSWLKGGKSFYGLLIQGDSMFPKYNEKDIVIFEQSNDYEKANNKDCAVMVNGYDATFKNVTINQNGITLVPLNIDNVEGYKPTFYNKEDIERLPVRIIGIAREKRTRL